jgi:hypothetical protein
MMQHNVYDRFPDFGPSPTHAEVLSLRGASNTALPKQAQQAIDRVFNFEKTIAAETNQP